MSKRWTGILCGMAAAVLLHAADQGPPVGRSLHRLVLSGQATDHVNYLLYLPPGVSSPAAGWPLILFLHGSEQRGDDPSLLESLPILSFAEEDEGFPFAIVVPQCPAGQQWSSQTLLQVLDDVEAGVPVDANRVYLTGFSMGGYGTWQTAAALSGIFAAIAPLCAPGDLPDVPMLAGMPVWAFHGALDQNVPLSETVNMVNALRQAGGDPQLTVYPDLAHDCWTMTYRDSRLYLWFMDHSLSDDSRIAARSVSNEELFER